MERFSRVRTDRQPAYPPSHVHRPSRDSLYRISTQFRVSVADLLQWNNLSPERYLQPGQQLILFVDVTDQST